MAKTHLSNKPLALVATYRLQLLPHMKFADVENLLPYLKRLGVSHIYSSPIARARRGSTHGYDVVDPNRVNPELGSVEDLYRLLESVRAAGLGWIQDIVPNHMGFHPQNRFLMSLLEFRACSPFRSFFDISWYSPLTYRVIPLTAPLLRRKRRTEISRGRLKLRITRSRLEISYGKISLPLAITSYLDIANLMKLKASRSSGHLRAFIEKCKLLREVALESWKPGTLVKVKALRNEAISLLNYSRTTRQLLLSINSQKDEALSEIMNRQNYRLEPYNVDSSKINYRRFTNVNSLIALRNQDEGIISHTHRLVRNLLVLNLIDGLRIDHIDGFLLPRNYIRWLRSRFPDPYLFVEKILTGQEELQSSWDVQGTTGYDFLRVVNGIQVKRTAEPKMDKVYEKFIQRRIDWQGLGFQCKRISAQDHRFEITRIASILKQCITDAERKPEIDRKTIERALVDFLAGLPVYRTYVGTGKVGRSDRKYIMTAFSNAKVYGKAPGLKILEDTFLDNLEGSRASKNLEPVRNCLMRLQQVSPAIVAKGIEDKAFYIFNRLLSLNEVGCDPGSFGCSVGDFHRFNLRRLHRWPLSINATSTHDTKRSEDVRARLNVLSELPRQWQERVEKWHNLNLTKSRQASLKIDLNDEYHFYQTLIGTFPPDGGIDGAYRARLEAYMIKAIREAGIHSSWSKQGKAYEKLVHEFVRRALDPETSHEFLADLADFAKKVAFYGYLNSLSQVILKVMSPGVPDFYQGCEVWSDNLVDPDNRRPVDFEALSRRLYKLRKINPCPRLIKELLADMSNGQIKMFVTATCLRLRAKHLQVFLKGSYIPLKAKGRHREHVISFARNRGRTWIVVIVPRLIVKLCPGGDLPLGSKVWGDTEVELSGEAPNYWLDIFTGKSLNTSKRIYLAKALSDFPMSVLVGR